MQLITSYLVVFVLSYFTPRRRQKRFFQYCSTRQLENGSMYEADEIFTAPALMSIKVRV